MGSATDPLSERCGWTAEDVRSHWNWAAGSNFNNFRAGLADMHDSARCGSGLEETAEHAYYSERGHLFWYHAGK